MSATDKDSAGFGRVMYYLNAGDDGKFLLYNQSVGSYTLSVDFEIKYLALLDVKSMKCNYIVKNIYAAVKFHQVHEVIFVEI